MKYDEIAEHWNTDSVIGTNLDLKSVEISQLHNKYFKFLSIERIQLRRIEGKFDELMLTKTQYYLGTLDDDTIKENGWKQWDRRTLKGDLPLYLNADQDIIAMKMRISVCFERVDFLTDILKQLIAMGWNIKNAIEFQKFKNGGY